MSGKNLKEIALDLSKNAPASPRESLGGYVIAKRALDKCRAVLTGTNDEYHFDCPLDNMFFGFAGITGSAFKEFVATGASDEDVAAWIDENSKQTERRAVVEWNNKMRALRPCDMPIELQEFLEGYIPEFIPAGKIVRVWFDVYDIEEGRI